MTPAWSRVVVVAAALATAAVTAALGAWQLDRAAQKTALHEAIQRQRAMPALAEADLARDAAAVQAQLHRLVEVRGRWLPAHEVYLENRQLQGQPGFEVLTPLALADGTVVLVQRGWWPRDLLDRTRIEAPAAPEGEISVPARVALRPARLVELGPGAQGRLRQNLDIADFARETGLPLRPLLLVQTAATGSDRAAPADLKRHPPEPASGVAKHHGYAAQWFGLSLLSLGLLAWFQGFKPWLARQAWRAASNNT